MREKSIKKAYINTFLKVTYYILVVYILFILGADAHFRGENYCLLFYETIIFLIIFDITLLILRYNKVIKNDYLIFLINSIIGIGCIIYLIFVGLIFSENYFLSFDFLNIIYIVIPVILFVLILLKLSRNH